MTNIVIGIIGGTGNMGRWFKDFFLKAGHKVLVSGRKTSLRPRDMAKKSNIIMLSMPIKAAMSTCEDIGPLLSSEQLLMDLCSLKEKILNKMLDSTRAQVVGTHPLFGPFTDSIKGQNVIICPGRGTSRLEWIEEEFQSRGAVIRRMDPVIHDRNMAVVQGLTHFLTVCMGRTLQKMNIAPDELKSCSTPVFRLNLDLIGRLFSQDPDLYKSLIGANRHVKDVLPFFMSALNETKKSLLSDEKGDATAYLEDIRNFFGEFCSEGLKESNKILSDLYS